MFTYVLSTPEIGVRCAFTPVVNHFDEDFLYPREQPPLREGDTIVQVGDVAIQNWPQLLRTLLAYRGQTAEALPDLTAADLVANRGPVAERNHLLWEGQTLVRVRYERGGEVGSAWCRLGPTPVETLLPTILWFLLKIGLFVVGAIVFWKRPDDRSAAQFFLLCGVSLGAYIGGYHWSRIVTQPVLLVVFMVASLFLPAVTLHFYLLFPRPKALLDRFPRAAMLLIYGPALVTLGLLLVGYFRVRWLYFHGVGDPMAGEMVRLQLQEMLAVILAYFSVAMLWYLASVGCLVHSFFTARDATQRNQVKWILVGAAAATAPIGYSLYLAFWEQGRFGGGAATWPMFAASACVTAAFTISITRYRLMELDRLITSGVSYFLISSLAGVIYFGLVFTGMLLVGSRVAEGPSLGQVLGVASTALVLMIALDVARGRFKAVLDRHFRREKGQLDRTLQRMSETIQQLVDPPTLARRLLHTAAGLLGIKSGAVFLRQGEPALYGLTDALGPPPELRELPPGCPLVEALHAEPTLLLPPGPVPPGSAQARLRLLGGEVAQALDHEGQLLGVLVLGPKERGVLTLEDLQLLGAFARLTALALVSAEGHRTIEALNRELQAKVVKIAEQQRRILALQSQLTDRRRAAEPAPEPPPPAEPPAGMPEGMVGSGPRLRQLMHLVKKVAAGGAAVLLRGESGTGKELIARALHENSPRAGKPFLKVHCAALSPGLLESELFGHVKGAFTHAIRDKVGRFEAAHGGTLFLDEIGDITPEVQTKLLRVLQEMTFERVGSVVPVRVDVRIIAATHQNLEARIREGLFREDLYYRLNVLPITLPPLRDRAEDVPELVAHFLKRYAARSGREVVGVDDDALALLKAYRWPGNVRQLENVIERAVVVAEGPTVTPADLPPEVAAGPEPPDEFLTDGDGGPLPLSVAERHRREKRERELLTRALTAAAGNKAEAARALGVPRSTLLSRMKRHGLA